MAHAFVLGGCRTPIGKFMGGLSNLPAVDLGALVVAEALRRTNTVPGEVDEVVMGVVLVAGLGQAPARQAALKAGLPPTVAALTVNKVCGSGLKAVMLADQAIRAGDARCIVAGGMESMSRAPHLAVGSREGWKYGHVQMLDSMIHDGLWCPFENLAMGAEADYIAESRGASREDQDAFAVESHRRALDAWNAGRFDAEVLPVTVAGRKESTVVRRDEGPRPETDPASLARLKPAFGPQGTVTAGNASQISDGAAAVVVVDEAGAARSSSPLKARIVATATAGVPPKEIFAAPILAIEKVLEKAKLPASAVDWFELNEAFAAQCLVCMRPLGLDPAKVNPLGGAVALGHPIGASGARVLVTLLHGLAARKLHYGLAALCLGGGNAVAMLVERVDG